MAQTLGDLVTAALMNDFSRTDYGVAAKQAILDGAADIGATITLPTDVAVSTLTVLNGFGAVALPTTVRRIDSVVDPDGVELTEVATDWIDTNPGQRGKPTAYAL